MLECSHPLKQETGEDVSGRRLDQQTMLEVPVFAAARKRTADMGRKGFLKRTTTLRADDKAHKSNTYASSSEKG
jgi:hypothetical protein